MAAWSVVVASPFHANWNFETGGTLAAMVLPGLIQNAFRAELFALGYALHQAALHGVAVRIWTDCLGVVNRFHFLARCDRDIRVNTVNADLWNWVRTSVQSIGVKRIQVIKVAAHQSLAKAKTRRGVWTSWNNDAADLSAKVANLDRLQETWAIRSRFVRELEECQTLHGEVFQLHPAVAELSAMATAAATLDDDQVPRQKRVNRVFEKAYDDSACTYQVPPKLKGLYPGKLPDKVVLWWKLRTLGASSGDLKWLPVHMIYLDFMMTFGCPGPIRVNNRWLEWDMCPFLTPEKHKHSLRTRCFRKFLLSALHAMGITINTATCRGSSEILQAFLPCVSARWGEMCLEQVEAWLSCHLSTHCGRGAQELRSLPIPDVNLRMNLPSMPPKMGS